MDEKNQRRLKPRKAKEHIRHSALHWIVAGFFCFALAVFLVPYLYAFSASLSDYKEYYFNIFPFPKDGLKLKNYLDAWTSLSYEGNTLPQMILNSLWFCGMGSILNVLVPVFGAYIVAFYKFRGRNFLYWFALITMMIPIVGSMPSSLKFINAMGGYNSYLYVFITVDTIGANFIIMYSCLKAVDWSYAESAFMDGAGHFTVFFKIMLPQVISPMTALILNNFIGAWGNAESSLVYYPDLPTLATGLYHFRTFVVTAEGMQRYPAYFAAIIMCIIPTVALFSIFQKKLMDIQLGGGLKG